MPGRRCAIYTRKSSEEGLEQSFNSLEAPHEACRAFILSQEQLALFAKRALNWRPPQIGVPTLILHGDDDEIVPIQDSALLSSEIIKRAILKVVPGAPHGMCSTLKDHINAELLAFLK
jgi:pimeloyl-ACP methyl ester carboxylesterase